jgi:hypothetical protein
MNLPPTVWIGARCYRTDVLYNKAAHDGEEGSHHGNTRIMEFDQATVEGPDGLDAFLHEVCEAIRVDRGIRLSHAALEQLASGLAAAIVQNGWVFDPCPGTQSNPDCG